MSIREKISFQLYSARNFPPLSAQLATLHRLGYTKVEPFDGLYQDLNRFADALTSHNLTAPSGHFGLDLLENDFPRALHIAQTLNMSLVICPFLPPDQRPHDSSGWQEFGKRLGKIALKFSAHHIDFGWHNHDVEMFRLQDGSFPLDHILSADRTIQWEPDIGWIARAGQDTVHWLNRYAGRITALHIKDVAPAGTSAQDVWIDVGYGSLNWAEIIPAGLAAGARILVMEHDNPANFEEFAARSMDTAKSW